MKLLIIDNYDSFIYNLVYEFQVLGHQVTVVRNDLDYLQLITSIKAADALVISPGPGTPANAGHSLRLIKEFYPIKPILGICLGHQAIVEAFGGKVISASQVFHGKTSRLKLVSQQSSSKPQNKSLFKGFADGFSVARYHSLSAGNSPSKLPEVLKLEALAEDGEIMAVSHEDYPVYGLQFHPESIMTRGGKRLLENFITLAKQSQQKNQTGEAHVAVA